MAIQNQRFVISFSSIFIFCNIFSLHCFAAVYNITSSSPLLHSNILISPAQVFELGFFRPNNSVNQYLGIWYTNVSPRTVVWVANRENPVNDSSASLKIGSDGILKLLDGNDVALWSTNVSVRSSSSVAVLLDDGNFVLQDGLSGQQIWKSFEHPGNMFLPGMGIGYDLETGERRDLSSWKSESDPSPGEFVFGLVPQTPPQAFVWRAGLPYWRSGQWDKVQFIGIPDMYESYRSAFSLIIDQGSSYFYMDPHNISVFGNMVMSSEGSLKLMFWEKETGWSQHWEGPNSTCDIYGTCGAFGVCESSESPICSCLRGFVPKSDEEWRKNNWTGGCTRRSELSCVAGTDKFWKLEGMKLPDDDSNYQEVKNVTECGQWCLNNCSCNAYAYVKGIRCMFWTEDLVDMQEFADGGEELFIRLASTELAQGNLRVDLIISLTIISFVIILCVLVYVLWLRRSKRIGKEKRTSKLLGADTTSDASDDILEYTLRSIMKNEEVQEISFVSFQSITVATNNFSIENKLGQGGFGPVYKGMLHNGTNIAVKRLSSNSGQGIEEFKNEVVLISKLQHRNLVRLFGCCVEGEERILIYEFMPNKSLDKFLFDPTRRAELSWAKRFNIIEGVARGLLYLHRDSCLRVIHRDLKVSNILLDGKMNPKISDFGLARMFEGTQYLANTHKIVGTLGYMSPEYALGGMFSEKSDVFSFGVLLLEIVSGKKVNNFVYLDEHLSLLFHAWNVWSQGEELSLVDEAVADSFSTTEVKRCIRMALLCVQDHAEDRPTMAAVVSMLSGEAELPLPEQPTFTFQRPKGNNSYSICAMTSSLVQGR